MRLQLSFPSHPTSSISHLWIGHPSIPSDMDPISALGVASNILAVVDFAWAILTEARTIHQSSSGFGSEAEFVDTITHDVSLLDQRLLSSTGATGELQVLVAESQKVVSALRDALSSLKTRKSGPKRQSCVAALKETWGRDKVSGLMTRLGTLRSRIMMHIQMIMQYAPCFNGPLRVGTNLGSPESTQSRALTRSRRPSSSYTPPARPWRSPQATIFPLYSTIY